MFCPKCGAENDGEAVFCAKCGALLDDSTESQGSYERRAISPLSGISSSAIPGLVFGAIIVFIGITLSLGRDIGQIFGGWGSNFGEFMGNWGTNFGEFMGNWGENMGRFFADWGSGVGVSFGAMITIIIGLAIIASTLSAQNRR
jgi:hypothetical protein